ncbi:HEXXH motif domain-containing protein [Actinomadura nitritigenes]|uniref:HEXXH motif domain-containing protein n=1 Tax=Actinomadura nitritigenes TaxID=134602 RepID=UPI003D9493CE
MSRRHRLTSAGLDRLAAGPGEAADLALLRRGQLSRRLIMIEGVVRRAEPGLGLRAAAGVLAETRRGSPASAERSLLHPCLGTWAARSLAAMAPGGPPERVPADPGYLAALAAAAVLSSDAVVRHRPLRLEPMGGAVVLPGLGRLHSPGPHCGLATLDHGRLLLAGRRSAPGWQAVRRFRYATAGLRIDLALEDLDPYRDDYVWPVSPRLSATEAERWRAALARAWSLLAADHRLYAEAMGRVLAAVVPLKAGPAGSLAATSPRTFGAVALAFVDDPVELAALLVHEVQHMKLAALLDLVPLHTGAGDALHRVPWRPDPRPVEGVLQGTYAHLGLSDFWAARCVRGKGPGAHRARERFALHHAHAVTGSLILRAADELTPAGRRFAGTMAEALRLNRRHAVLQAPATTALPARAERKAADAGAPTCFRKP